MVAWIALVLSALSLAYSVWNEVTKRRLQYEARFVISVPDSEYGADFDEPKELTIENVGSGNAHDVLLVHEYDPAGVGFGEFKWRKIPAGESASRLPSAKLPEGIDELIVAQQLRDRSPWWRRKVVMGNVYWRTPMGKVRRQRITRTRRSLRL
jgi:hypothetical protein